MNTLPPSEGSELRPSRLLRLALYIASVRIAAIWLAMFGLRSPGWPQVASYLLAMLGLPEIYLVRSTRDQLTRWAAAASLVLAASSIGWAALFLWIRERRWTRPKMEIGRH